MLPLAFFGQNLHFALDLFVSLVCFATFWLYFDAWLPKKKTREVFKWFGFLLVSLSFLVGATLIEQGVLGTSFFGNATEIFAVSIRLLGYLSIIVALFTEPLQEMPITSGITKEKNFSITSVALNLKFALPLGALIIALQYYRRSTKGLERHLRPIAFAFFFLGVSESLGAATLLRSSSNVQISQLVAPFGWVWWSEQVFLLVGGVVLGVWVWSYLVKRLQSQLFMIFTGAVLAIFLIVSVTFTYLLVSNIQQRTLNNLETATNVFNYSLDAKRAEIGAKAQVYSQNPAVATAIGVKDHKQLALLLATALSTNKVSSITIVNKNSLVLLRAENPDKWGDSISSDPLIQKALIGESESTLVTTEAMVPSSILSLQAAEPIKKDEEVIGAVLVGLNLSNNFLDGIKSSTGLDASLYAGNVRSATTLLSSDGTRAVGVSENNSQIKEAVLSNGKVFKGAFSFLNQPVLGVYQPLKNVNNQIVGMSFAGEPQVLILKDSGRSIEIIFALSALLLLVSILPSFLISRYISNQLH